MHNLSKVPVYLSTVKNTGNVYMCYIHVYNKTVKGNLITFNISIYVLL